MGDIVFIPHGAQTPFLIRRQELDHSVAVGENHYQLVGKAYVHGFMEGEVMTMDNVVETEVVLT